LGLGLDMAKFGLKKLRQCTKRIVYANSLLTRETR
jgi:hypothetical protein